MSFTKKAQHVKLRVTKYKDCKNFKILPTTLLKVRYKSTNNVSSCNIMRYTFFIGGRKVSILLYSPLAPSRTSVAHLAAFQRFKFTLALLAHCEAFQFLVLK